MEKEVKKRKSTRVKKVSPVSLHVTGQTPVREKKEIWFRAKLYGWGWTPVTWQGWVLTIIYIWVLVYKGAKFSKIAHSGSDFLIGFAPLFIVATALLLFVCYTKGEKPGWHWGNISHKPHP